MYLCRINPRVRLSKNIQSHHHIRALQSCRIPLVPRPRNYIGASKTDTAYETSVISRIGSRLGISSHNLDAWSQVTLPQIIRHGGLKLSIKSIESLPKLLSEIYPDHNWNVDASRFVLSPLVWSDTENLRAALLAVGENLGIREKDYYAWYKVSFYNFEEMGELEANICRRFNSSRISFLKRAFPEHVWEEKKFVRIPSSTSTLTEALIKIGEKLGIKRGDLDGWYKVSNRDLWIHGGRSFLGRGKTRYQILKEAFPDHPWDLEKFKTKTREYYKSTEVSRKLMVELGEKLGVKAGDYEAWYSISWVKFREFGGQMLLSHHGWSRIQLLKTVFPEYDWDPGKFDVKAPLYWDPLRQRETLLDVGKKLGIPENDFEQWYKFSMKKLIANGLPRHAFGFTKRYKLFSAVFPEHEWKPWLFVKSASEDVLDFSNEDAAFFGSYLEKKLNISDPNEWYSVKIETLEKLGFGKRYFPRQADLVRVLSATHPEIDWDLNRLPISSHGFGSLLSILVKIFGNDVRTSSKVFSSMESQVQWSEFQKALAVPKHKLLFDYQGPQFYVQQIVAKPAQLELVERMTLVKWCSENGYTLISVPFWAERDRKSIFAAILATRPDLYGEDGPLSRFRVEAEGADTIPTKIDFPDVNKGYLRLWASDRRFQHLFFPAVSPQDPLKTPIASEE